MSKLTEPIFAADTIGSYTFEEFMRVAAAFHGTASPGLMLGAFMVEAVRAALPPGILFDAVVETMKCLPDAVQLLTPPSYGNGWMQVINLGRFAVSLYDKHTGEGFRAWLDPQGLDAWPEIHSWYLKTKRKKDQDRERLFAEIKAAGRGVCRVAAVRIRPDRLGRPPMGATGICPKCGEGYPLADGDVCRGCSGQSPYVAQAVVRPGIAAGTMGKTAAKSSRPVDRTVCHTCRVCAYPHCPSGKPSP